MEKHEQSFEFTDLPAGESGTTGNGAEQTATAGRTVAGRAVTPLGKGAAHKLSGSAKPKTERAAEGSAKARPVALGKMVKAGSSDQPIKAKAVAQTVSDRAEKKHDSAPVVVKAVQVAQSIDSIDKQGAVQPEVVQPLAVETEKKSSDAAEIGTGPTRKLPIPMGKQGVQLTEENIAHRSGRADKANEKTTAKPAEKSSTDTDPTQKIEMPPPEEQPEFIEITAAESDATVDSKSADNDSDQKTEAVIEKKGGAGKAPNPPSDMINFGIKLREARLAKGLSLTDIEEQTKIRKIYIEALENEVFDRLPPMVYVCAYVKTLANLYGMDVAVRDEIVGELRQLQPTHLSDATIQNMHIDCELDEAEEHRLKLIITVGSVGVAVLAVVISVMFWLRSNDNMSEVQLAAVDGSQTFNRSELEKLSPPQRLKMSVLTPPVGGKGIK